MNGLKSSRRAAGPCLLLLLLVVACSPETGGNRLREPPAIHTGKNGILYAALTAKASSITVDGTKVQSTVYNGRFIPPTLFVNPGDTIQLILRNQLPQNATNLHYHGMNVSPLPSADGQGDDVFLQADPGQEILYSIEIPDDHPEGMFYYHPHQHGLTEAQVGGGMSGGIIVSGLLDPFPQLADIRQRVLLLKDLQILPDGTVNSPPDPGEPTTRTINGQINPRINIHPGEVQLWSVGNVGADLYYHLSLDGHVLYEVARDGNRHTRLIPRTEIMLPTAARTQFLVVGGPHGDYVLRALPQGNRPPDYDPYFEGSNPVYDGGSCTDEGLDNTIGCESSDGTTCMGPQADCNPGGVLATMVSHGTAVATPALPTAEQFPLVEDLRERPVCRQRTFDFQETVDGDEFFINGKQFDMDRIDTEVELAPADGCVEEWVINNCTGENHVFHIHQLDYQVVSVGGQAVEFVGHQDPVNLPFRDCDRDVSGACRTLAEQGQDWPIYGCPTGGSPRNQVVLRIPFDNPVIAGKFVYHCHIGGHEDNGMMAVIEVCDDERVPCPAGSSGDTPGAGDHHGHPAR